MRDEWRWVTPVLVGLLGLFMAHHPMLISGLEQMQTDPVDTRLVNALLEHGHRWATGDPRHAAFWDPPLFYPARNVAAYSDTLLGGLPWYAPFRLLGLPRDTAFQAFLLATSAFNFLGAAWLLRRGLGCGRVGAVAGAYLFAFAAPRVNQLGHPQLLPQAYLLLVLAALARLVDLTGQVDSTPRTRRLTWLWGLAVGPALAGQAYTSVYTVWFLAAALGVGIIVAGATRKGRAALGRLGRRAGLPLALGLVAGLVLVAPLARHSLEAARAVGLRRWEDVQLMVPHGWSWLYLGPESWVWGWTAGYPPLRDLAVEHEHRLGLGVLTPALALAGLWIGRRRQGLALVVIPVAVLALLGTAYPGGFAPWQTLRDWIPTASALRAISRIGLFLLLPAAWGLALLADDLTRRGRWAFRALLILAPLMVLEQAVTTPSYRKSTVRNDVAFLSARIDPEAACFYFSPGPGYILGWPYHRDPNLRGQNPYWKSHLDAVEAAFATGVPTVNGYSGNTPPGWMPLALSVLRGPDDQRRLQAALAFWMARQGQPRARVQWLQPKPGGETGPRPRLRP